MVDKICFFLDGIVIPFFSEKPVKSLSKVFNCRLRDATSILIVKEFENWLTTVDKSGLPGRFKAWIYQHCFLPLVLWPLLVYEVTLSTVEILERKVNAYLRRWLGLPRSLCCVALYGRSNKLLLLISSLNEEFRVAHTRETVLYRDSRDSKVESSGIMVQTGRKSRARETMEIA